jgi:hypothetical protein
MLPSPSLPAQELPAAELLQQFLSSLAVIVVGGWILTAT